LTLKALIQLAMGAKEWGMNEWMDWCFQGQTGNSLTAIAPPSIIRPKQIKNEITRSTLS
jgi:hypothetical protein